MSTLFLGGKVQLFDDAGAVLSGGKVYFFQVGTSTPKDTYTDASLSTPNTNPVILDSAGRADIWLSGDYKVRVDDANDVTIYTAENVNPGVGPATGSGAHGACRFTFLSATSCQLANYKGNTILVKTGGVWELRTVAPAISVTNAGLSASTVYYAYCYDNAGLLALEFDTTGYSNSPETGVEVKSTDDTRTLVGLVRTNASSQFAFSPDERLVASHFNQLPFSIEGANIQGATIGSASPTEIGSGRAGFVNWKNTAPIATLAGSLSSDTNTVVATMAVGLDVTTTFQGTQAEISTTTVGAKFPFSASFSPDISQLAEGFHEFIPLGSRTPGGPTVTMGTSVRLEGTGWF